MADYNRNPLLPPDRHLDDTTNALALRSDIHSCFDDKRFAIVPKEGKWVPHFFQETDDLGPLYHNQAIDMAEEISAPFLLARLAWAIFPMLGGFMNSGGDRQVCILVKVGDNFEERIEKWSSEKFREMISRPKGGGQSPSKRKSASPEKDPNKRSRPLYFSERSPHQTKRRRRASISDFRTSGLNDLPTMSAADLKPSRDSDLPEFGVESSQAAPWDMLSAQSGSDTPLPDRNPLDTVLPGSSFPPTRPYRPDDPLVKQSSAFNSRMMDLRQKWLETQRPKDPALICCDYDRADCNYRAGVEGPREYGGAHLCMECLGAEYPLKLDDEEVAMLVAEKVEERREKLLTIEDPLS